jgi:hypothetical protein
MSFPYMKSTSSRLLYSVLYNITTDTLCCHCHLRSQFLMRPSPAVLSGLRLSAFEECLVRGDVSLVIQLFSFWPILSIVRLKAVNFLLKSIIEGYIRNQWDIDSFLSEWFDGEHRPCEFREVLGQCDGIVSGSQALQFFDRTYFPDSDFDIFLRPEGTLRMGRFLQDCGYMYIPSATDVTTFDHAFHLVTRQLLSIKGDFLGYPNRSIIKIFNFRRLNADEEYQRNSGRIQIVVVKNHPIKHILTFHSSKLSPLS